MAYFKSKFKRENCKEMIALEFCMKIIDTFEDAIQINEFMALLAVEKRTYTSVFNFQHYLNLISSFIFTIQLAVCQALRASPRPKTRVCLVQQDVLLTNPHV